MDRRRFVVAMGGAIACSGFAFGQSSVRVPRTCYLGNTTLAGSEHLVQAWLAGLREHGWRDGQNLRIDFHWGEARLERIETLAAELVKGPCELIFASEFDEFAVAGGLASHGPNWTPLFRRAASHVDRVLRGAKPGDLPIEQPTHYELVLNQKTAAVLGIRFPQTVLLRADRVIE